MAKHVTVDNGNGVGASRLGGGRDGVWQTTTTNNIFLLPRDRRKKPSTGGGESGVHGGGPVVEVVRLRRDWAVNVQGKDNP